MALPGNITSRLSKGTNRLIRDGAAIITCAEDIFNTLGINNNEEKQKNSEKNNISLAPEEKLVYDCIHSEPITSDEIVISTGLSARDVQYELTMLELQGLITRLSGQQYVLK
jgi:DNA processing protein